MKMRLIILSAVLMILTVGCYEDKGNYNYDFFNDLSIDFEQKSYAGILGKPLVIIPRFTFAVDSNEAGLSYQWSLANKVISDTRNLNYLPDTIGSQSIFLRVEDHRTGIVYLGNTFANITSEFGTVGWMILSVKDQKSCLSYIREKDVTGGVSPAGKSYEDFPGIYKQINGTDLGSEPIQILEHFCSSKANVLSSFWIVQGGPEGCIDVSGETFKKEITLEDAFIDGQLPEGLEPVKMMDMKWLTMVADRDGKIYSRKKSTPDLFNSGYFLDMPLTYKGKTVNGLGIVNTRCKDLEYCVVLDQDRQNPEDRGRFLLISDRKTSEAGKVEAIKVDESLYLPGITRLDDLGGMKVLHCGAFGGSDEYYQGYLSVMESPAGDLYLHQFMIQAPMYGFKIRDLQQIAVPELKNIIDGTSKNVYNVVFDKNTPYLLISKNNELFLYERNAKQLLPYGTFDADITAIDTESPNNAEAGIGLKNGNFFVLDISRDAVNDLKERVLYESTTDFGDIVSIRYKVQKNRFWNY